MTNWMTERTLVKRVLNFCLPRALHCCCVVSKLWHITAFACAFSKERSFLAQLPSCTTGATESIRLALRSFLASKMIDERIEEWIPAVRAHTLITTRKKILATGDRCLRAGLLVVSVTAPSQTKLQRAVLIRCAKASHYDSLRDDVREDCATLITRISLDPPQYASSTTSCVFSPSAVSTADTKQNIKATNSDSHRVLLRPSAITVPKNAHSVPVKESDDPVAKDLETELRELSARVDADLAQIKSLDLEFRQREGTVPGRCFVILAEHTEEVRASV